MWYFRIRALAAVAICLICFEVAQADDLAARRAAAESYVKSPVLQQMMDKELSVDAFLAHMQRGLPELSEEDAAIMARVVTEEYANARVFMEAAWIEAAIETFTVDEIRALDAFYRSKQGISAMSKISDYERTFQEKSREDIQLMVQRLERRFKQEGIGP
jgi:hypothetical protein